MTKVQKGESAARNWNAGNPAGTQVSVRLDNGETRLTKTRSEAWVLGDGTPVVQLEGFRGGYLLDRVQSMALVQQ